MFIIKAYAAGVEQWVTIKGVHVLIGGNGRIVKGPAKFIGSTVEDLQGGSGKYSSSKKSSSSSSSKSSGGGNSSSSSASNSSSSSGGSSSEPKKSYSWGGIEVTEGVETFTHNGVTYRIDKIKENGVEYGRITYYDKKLGREVNKGENKDFLSVKSAKEFLQETDRRTAAMNNAKAIAEKTGGVALYTGKVIVPGSVHRSGTKDGNYQYSATDATTGKTIELDGRDMGAVMIAGMDARQKAAVESFKSTSSSPKGRTTAPAKTSNSTFNSAASGATMKKYPSGITTAAQKRAYTRALNSGKSTSEAVKIAKNAGTSSQTTYVAGFSNAMNREFQRLVSSGMSEDEAVSVVTRNSGYGRNGRGWHR